MEEYAVTAKGICFAAALNNGLVRALDGSRVDMKRIHETASCGVDATDFEKFWKQFTKDLFDAGWRVVRRD